MKWIAAFILLGGCVSMGWVHPNKSGRYFDDDLFACEKITARMYPVVPAVTPRADQGQTHTECSSTLGGMECTTRPGPRIITVDPFGGQPYDANEQNRKKATGSCLRSKGWRYQRMN